MNNHRMAPVVVGIGPVTFDDVVRVARHNAPVVIADDSLAAIAASRARIQALADNPAPVYGVSTGFGALATRHIPVELRTQLQRSLIRSHAAGSGPEVEREVVRAMMLLRLSTLATGRTGVRPEVAQAYAGLLSAGLTPVVYEYGSLGCSGDLAPLAHVALAIMGEGFVRTVDGELVPAAEALTALGLEPIVLAEKEGLALINGTDGMLGQLVLALTDLDRLLVLADVSAAMSVEGLLGSDRVFGPHLQALRPQPGQAVAAANMTRILADSPIVASHSGPDCSLVQDAYSLRCAPRSPAPHETPWRMPATSRTGNWPAPSTTRSSPSTDRSNRTETSTAHPSPTCSTSSPSSSPISPASVNGVPTGSWTRPAVTGSTRSWPTTQVSTVAT